jgi:hypothetical protein
MIKSSKINYYNYIFAILFSSFWSLNVFFDQAGDYGTYLAISFLINEGQILYSDLFDHKGPFFYYFLAVIDEFIGTGFYQSFITLIIICLVFLTPLIYLINKKISNSYLQITLLLLIFSSFYAQNSNSSIALFQAGLIISFFIFLIKSLDKLDNFRLNWFISCIFISLAILTRIDSFIFLPILFLVFFKRNLLEFFIALIFFILFFIFLISVLSFQLNFDLKNYIYSNYFFNFWYGNLFIKIFFYRPQQYAILLVSGVLISLIIILNYCFNKMNVWKIFLKYLLLRKKFKTKFNKFNLSLIFVFFGFMSLIIALNDVYYYLYIFYAPALYFIVSWSKFVPSKFYKYSIVMSIYCIMLISAPIAKNLIKKTDCINDFINNSCSNLESTIIDPDFKGFPIVIGDNGWIIVLSGSNPKNVFTNWWFYYGKKPFKNNSLINSHKKIIEMPPNTKLWIQKSLIKYSANQNQYLNEIFKVSSFIEDQGKYIKYKIK